MILITKIETREVPESYAQVCSMELRRNMNPQCEAVDGAGEPCYADAGDYTTETVRGRRFTRSKWNKEKQEVEIISDVVIGMTADVQNVLGIQVEEWEDMELRLKSRGDDVRDLCLRLENSQVETQRFTGMTRWKRIKWALTKK